MKAKVTRGCGVKGLLRYAFDVGPKATGSKRAEQVGGNMVGQDIRELEQEFGIVYRLRPDIAKPVWHCSLSLPTGERLEKDKWDKVVADFLKQMQFDLRLTQYVAVRHQDTKYDHVHIIVSRVRMDARVWLGRWEARRVIEATQVLEIRHGLTQTVGLGDTRAARRRPGSDERNLAERTQEETVRSRLQKFVDVAVEGNPTAVMFAKKMVEQGAEVRVNFSKSGEINGFSYQLDGVCLQSGQLGKQYSWRGLKERGVTYDQDRDHAELLKFSHQAAVDPKINNDDTTPGMVVDVQQQVGIGTTEPLHVEAVATNTESFDLLTQGSQVSMPDAELVHLETHHAEIADPSVGSRSRAESVQADIEMGSELVALLAMEERDENGNGNDSEPDTDDIAVSDLLQNFAEDQLCAESVDEQQFLMNRSAEVVEVGIQVFETIEDALLTRGEKTIEKNQLLVHDSSSISDKNINDKKTIIEEAFEAMDQTINQPSSVKAVVELESQDVVVSVVDVSPVPPGDPLESKLVVVPDTETLSKKLAILDESLSNKNKPEGPKI